MLALKQQVSPNSQKTEFGFHKIAIPVKSGFQFVASWDILSFEGNQNYSILHLTDGTKLMSSRNLKYHEQNLSDDLFFRSSKSHIVNILFVKSYVRGIKAHLVLEDGSIVPVSKSRKAAVLTHITSR